MIDPHLIVRREDFELRLYRRSREKDKFVVAKRYEIAVGQVGRETPAGFYWVTDKDRHPDYTYPLTDWVAPALRGKKIKFGENDNPLAGRWIGLWDAVGIHGTYDRDSIRTPASHGCIRMFEEDVVELYDLVDLNTPVYIY